MVFLHRHFMPPLHSYSSVFYIIDILVCKQTVPMKFTLRWINGTGENLDLRFERITLMTAQEAPYLDRALWDLLTSRIGTFVTLKCFLEYI